MLASFRQQKTVCLVVHTVGDILNNGVIPVGALGKPTVNGGYMRPFIRLIEVRGWYFMMLTNNDALYKS